MICQQSIVAWIDAHKAAGALLERSSRTDAVDSSSSSSSAPNSSAIDVELKAMMEDKVELADMLQETIDALQAEVAEVRVCGDITSTCSLYI